MEHANAYDAQSLSFMRVTTIGLSASGTLDHSSPTRYRCAMLAHCAMYCIIYVWKILNDLAPNFNGDLKIEREKWHQLRGSKDGIARNTNDENSQGKYPED